MSSPIKSLLKTHATFLKFLLFVSLCRTFPMLSDSYQKSPSDRHYQNQTYYGYFQNALDAGSSGSAIFSLRNSKIGAKNYFKARLIIFKESIIVNSNWDLYGFEKHDSIELYTDKVVAFAQIDPVDRLEVMQFYGFMTSKRHLMINGPVYCDYKINMSFDKKVGNLHKEGDVTLNAASLAMGRCDMSPNNFSIVASIKAFKKFDVLANRAIYITFAINIATIALMIHQIRFSSSVARSSKLSFYTFMHIGVLDSFVIMILISASVTYQSLFSAITLVIITQFCIFTIFDMKFAVMIVTARIEHEEINQIDEMRARLGRLYLKFCAILIVSTLAIYTESIDLFSILFCSFWVPQIAFNIFYSVNRVFRHSFLVGISLSKLSFFFYYYGIPNYNLLRGEGRQNYLLLAILAVVLFAQVAILIAMDRFGPRFFIPEKWRPQKYSYFRPIPDNDVEANNNNTCVVCLSNIVTSDKTDVMVTPCDHVFHTECLSSWMDEQLKCPICRYLLPAQIN